MKTLAFALAASVLTVGAAQAQSYAQTETSPLTIGAGVSYAPEYSGADDFKSRPIPMISAKTELTPGNTLYLKGLSAGLDHQIDERFSVGLMGTYRWERDSSDSAILRGLKDIDATVAIGPKLRFQATPQLGFEGNVLFDAGNSDGGMTARAGADYAMPLSEVTLLTLSGGINYGSDDYMTTYYGVPANRATAARPAYSPASGISHVDAQVGVRQSFTQNWSVMGGVGADYLIGDAADSPLVEKDLQPQFMLGLAYSF